MLKVIIENKHIRSTIPYAYVEFAGERHATSTTRSADEIKAAVAKYVKFTLHLRRARSLQNNDTIFRIDATLPDGRPRHELSEALFKIAAAENSRLYGRGTGKPWLNAKITVHLLATNEPAARPEFYPWMYQLLRGKRAMDWVAKHDELTHASILTAAARIDELDESRRMLLQPQGWRAQGLLSKGVEKHFEPTESSRPLDNFDADMWRAILTYDMSGVYVAQNPDTWFMIEATYPEDSARTCEWIKVTQELKDSAHASP